MKISDTIFYLALFKISFVYSFILGNSNKKFQKFNLIGFAKLGTKISQIPQNLPFSQPLIGNFTNFSEFQIAMLNLKLNRFEIKELFHIIDVNNDKTIQDSEWKNFYNLFGQSFKSCDQDDDILLNSNEVKKCLKSDKKFSNTLNFNLQWAGNLDKLLLRIFNSFDLDRDENLNLYDYIKLRYFNNAYDILLSKEGFVNYNNFEVAIHIICKNIKFYEYGDFARIFNRTIPNAYFSSKQYMDFATFSTLGNLFKLFINNNHHTLGYISYTDLLSVGQYIQTYKLIQNYTQLFIKNHLIYENLSQGTKMENLIYLNQFDYTERNFLLIKDFTKKISVEHLFFLYRHFDSLYTNKIKFPFTITSDNFKLLLLDDLFTDFNSAIFKANGEFQKVSKTAGVQNIKSNSIDKFIFRILDINNSTYLEIYEILLAQKALRIFNSLQKDGTIENQSNKTDSIQGLIKNNFNDMHILSLDKNDVEYLTYINYKFNSRKINFHQFLFLYFNRIRNTQNLVFPEDIINDLNYFGFFISQNYKNNFFQKYEIRDDDYLSYILAIQKFMEFYTNQL